MKNKYVIIFILLILSISLSGCFLFPPIEKPAEWTVMIYLDADNNLESAGIDDINEMEMVGSTTEVNIVVQADRIEDYDVSNDNWKNTRRYYITQDSDDSQINSQLIEDLPELNMGDPQTLIDFTSWAITNYPAKKYLLVIWNHGGGFRSSAYTAKDIAWDETSEGDRITMPELESALSGITTQTGGNIDIVGMDACFMAMTEVAYQIKDCGVDILVASEETEPFDGWPYDTILAQLVDNPAMTSAKLASVIVDKYIDSYPSGNVTQSAIDLSYMDDLAGQLSGLAQAIMDDTLTPKLNYINAASSSQSYGDPDFKDLYDFCAEIRADEVIPTNVKDIALDIQQTLNSAIIHSRLFGATVSNSHGLSVYFPNSYYDIYYDKTSFSQDYSKWVDMLKYLLNTQ